MKRLSFILPALLVASAAYAADTRNLSGTIAVTNTFQSIEPSVLARSGCLIQNNGSNTMYVYFGAIANATTAKSVKLSAGQSVSCNVGQSQATDQISITGTSGDAFYAGVQ